MTSEKEIELSLAARVIERYMGTLNLRRKDCAHCGRETYDSFADAQEHKELAAIVRKLRKFAGGKGKKSG